MDGPHVLRAAHHLHLEIQTGDEAGILLDQLVQELGGHLIRVVLDSEAAGRGHLLQLLLLGLRGRPLLYVLHQVEEGGLVLGLVQDDLVRVVVFGHVHSPLQVEGFNRRRN